MREEGITNTFVKSTNYVRIRLSEVFREVKYKGRDALRQLRYIVNTKEEISISIENKRVSFVCENYETFARIKLEEEPVILTALLKNVRPTDTFYDIGANIGRYSCILGVLRCTDVVAFEPYPPNVRVLERNTELNDINIDIHEVALSDERGISDLKILKSEEAGSQEHTLSDNRYNKNLRAKKSVQIKKRKGDELIEKGICSQPNVVKIDVEGAAPSVIKGMESALSSCECRVVIVEPHENFRLISRMLENIGFHVNTVDGRRWEPIVIGKKINR